MAIADFGILLVVCMYGVNNTVKEKKRLTAYGIAIKKRMLELNMTNDELAAKLGVDKSYVSRILYGVRSGRKYATQLSEMLGVEYDCSMSKTTATK